jgi:opacity protein-like surface antigen
MHKLVIVALLLSLLAAPAMAAEDDQGGNAITFSTGIDYSSGRYTQPKSTDIIVGLSIVALTTGAWRFSASMPYLNIVGPAYVVVGPGGDPVLVTQKSGANSTVREGWGDLSVGATYTWQPFGADSYEFDFTGNAKIATANASAGLTTGEDDASFSADVSHQFGLWSPFVSFSYLIPGSPKSYSLNSAPQFSVGTSYQVTSNIVATASYDFNGAITPTLSDAQQIFAAGSWVWDDSLSFTVYAEYGLTAGAPSEGTGLLVSWKLPI